VSSGHKGGTFGLWHAYMKVPKSFLASSMVMPLNISFSPATHGMVSLELIASMTCLFVASSFGLTKMLVVLGLAAEADPIRATKTAMVIVFTEVMMKSLFSLSLSLSSLSSLQPPPSSSLVVIVWHTRLAGEMGWEPGKVVEMSWES